MQNSECICAGNWRTFVKESEPLMGRWYRRKSDGAEFFFFGLVHCPEDYYYGLLGRDGMLYLWSCVSDFDSYGLVPCEAAKVKEDCGITKEGVQHGFAPEAEGGTL